MMTIPELAFFYGGMVIGKNVLSVLMQGIITFCLIALAWTIYGYSVAFTSGNAFFGDFDRLFLAGMTADSVVAIFSKGVLISRVCVLPLPAITPCLIIGALAARVRFSALLLFIVLSFRTCLPLTQTAEIGVKSPLSLADARWETNAAVARQDTQIAERRLPELESIRGTNNTGLRLKLVAKLPIRLLFSDRDHKRYADSASSILRGPAARKPIPPCRPATG